MNTRISLEGVTNRINDQNMLVSVFKNAAWKCVDLNNGTYFYTPGEVAVGQEIVVGKGNPRVKAVTRIEWNNMAVSTITCLLAKWTIQNGNKVAVEPPVEQLLVKVCSPPVEVIG